MATSQIGIASTASPFGHVLRDHNLRDQWSNRDSNASAFQNLQDFVDSISSQPNKKSQDDAHNENANNNDDKVDHADLWVHIPSYKMNEKNNDVPQSKEYDDRMAKDKGIKFSDDFTIKHQRVTSAPVSPVQIKVAKQSNNGGVSSLVRRWKDFEAEANNSPISSSRTTSIDIILNGTNHSDNDSLGDMRSETRSMSEDTFGDSESDTSEKERTRVMDIIRKLTSNEENSNDQESCSPRVSLDLEPQRGCDSPSMGSPGFGRRQSVGDLLLQQKRDRDTELQELVEMNAVSKFPQKGRIQAMLRIQFLRRGSMDAKDTRTNSTSLEVNRLSESSIKHLRERFKPVFQDSAPGWNSPKKEVGDSPIVEKHTSVQGNKGAQQHEVAVQTSIPKREVENTKSKKSLFIPDIVDGAAMSNDGSKKSEEKNILREACSNSDVLQERTKEDNISCTLRLSAETSVSSSAVKEVCSTKGDEKRLQPNILREACSNSDVLQERTKEDNISCSLHLSAETSVSSSAVKEVYSTKGDEKRLQQTSHERMSYSVELQENQEPNETIHERRKESVNTQREWGEECSSNQYLSESEHDWVSDVSHTQAGWEELHSDYELQSDGMQDWTDDISRPRSEWEDLRKERYQEMLDPFRKKEDICHLLESKSVSSFLSSALRDRIDQLMIGRTQQQMSRMGSLTDEPVVEEKESEYKVELEQELVEDVIVEIEGGDAGYDQANEDEYQVKQRYEESVENKDQTSSSPQFTSRNKNHGPGTSKCSDQVRFSPLQQDSPQHSYSHDSRPSSSMTNRCSMKVQLIYELRGHMEKLHKEMTEIRKSIKSCMNNQLKLQRYVEHDLVTTLGHSGGQYTGRNSTQKKGLINKSMCCICHDVQVDSLLYRCGHMCTCFKCAHELQQGSGRCPVCQATIIDVVRAHANS